MRFPNLKAEMARSGINGVEIAKRIGMSRNSLSNKMIGKSEFTRLEMMAIQSCFEGKTIEYLFEDPVTVER